MNGLHNHRITAFMILAGFVASIGGLVNVGKVDVSVTSAVICFGGILTLLSAAGICLQAYFVQSNLATERAKQIAELTEEVNRKVTFTLSVGTKGEPVVFEVGRDRQVRLVSGTANVTNNVLRG